jgi:uncharacterized cupredoxin-like copper-binding protein
MHPCIMHPYIMHRCTTSSNHALVIGTGDNVATEDLSFAPGTTETVSATLPAGTYTFICPVDGHATQGMTGTITVTP